MKPANVIVLVALWLSGVGVAVDFGELAHPRLWMTRDGEAGIRELVGRDVLAGRMEAAVVAEAGVILGKRTCRYEIPDGKRLLGESRLALHQVMHTAWAWRMTGEEKYRLRVIAELDAAAAMKDWNPSHFLDTAEMATAVATGYDWLYGSLTAEQRERYEEALVEKALKPARKVYDGGGWWAKPGNNWSQVCGAGIALAVVATAGHVEGDWREMFDRGLKLVADCGRFYEPDGNYPEGPGYWQYGTNYHVLMFGACEPLGLAVPESPVLRKAGESIMHLASPNGAMYNFADGGPGRALASPAQCWLARHFKDAVQARRVRDLLEREYLGEGGRGKGDRYFPLAILWLPAEPERVELPLAAVYGGQQAMAMFRSGWGRGDAYLAVKGGTAAASHGHMDVGSFVYDAHGRRWLHDLGAENYNLPGYFGGKRWTYYRLQNRSHNTLEIGGKLQDARSKPCPVVASEVRKGPFSATLDLSAAYAGSAGSVVRTAGFDPRTGVAEVSDRIVAPVGEVVWRAFTDAEVGIEGAVVTLRKGGEAVRLERLSAEGVWSVDDAAPPTKEENPNRGFREVVLRVPAAAEVGVRVAIRP